ncbi:4'-phosphopantetheinyl transferase family protein [Marinobacter sp. F4206]|uniref:4'-phosphopantetheinyl transferase family protein n=1 Tax=Marinobacter sp. F4206 TaxID=2861777 RepID=UPI001C5DEDCC|nr:4'-phosphopantetheinyl transferase superfamily protein [Marinobacter sp. F4206]MBW4933390.1 4'-phosphopantetheinyl transferase superfamily protein [Marinobacter sp. F4206]
MNMEAGAKSSATSLLDLFPGANGVNGYPMITDHTEAIEKRLRHFSQATLYLCMEELTQNDSAYASERQLMQQALAKRRKEFFSGRHLARQALKRAGFPVQAIARGPLGNPIWPAQAIGSITHDQRYGAVIVGHERDVAGIGIDLIEDPNQVDSEIASLFMHPDEKTILGSRFPDAPVTAVVFSIKESVVKAISVHIGRFMDLLEIHLTVSNHCISARIDGLPFHIPCIVIATEFGLLTASILRSEN